MFPKIILAIGIIQYQKAYSLGRNPKGLVKERASLKASLIILLLTLYILGSLTKQLLDIFRGINKGIIDSGMLINSR